MGLRHRGNQMWLRILAWLLQKLQEPKIDFPRIGPMINATSCQTWRTIYLDMAFNVTDVFANRDPCDVHGLQGVLRQPLCV